MGRRDEPGQDAIGLAQLLLQPGDPGAAGLLIVVNCQGNFTTFLLGLQKLMGHADLTVLRRYLAQTETDLAEAHKKAGPVDRLL